MESYHAWTDTYRKLNKKTGAVEKLVEVQYWFYMNNAVVNHSRYYMKFIQII